MAVLTNMRFLSTARINRILGTLASELEIARPLNFLARTPLVDAFDDELTGRFTGRVIAADIIADDQKAVVQESMQIELVTHSIPNIKIGQRIGQATLNRLRQLEMGTFQSVQGENALKDWDMKVAENLLLGVRQRMNAMACSMMLDTFSYNRFGVQITSASWGMPSDLKVTTGTAWSNITATPIADILAIDQTARLTYGVEFDTVTMGTLDFRDLVATTEFANKAGLILQAHYLTGPAALLTKNDPEMLTLAQRILGKTIELDDTTYREKSNAGETSTTKVLPAHKVLLSRKQDEGSGQAYDFANGVTTESIVADLIGQAPSGIGGEQFGPVGYYAGNMDLNPPDVVAWAVARAFPRKHIPESTAVLTVG